MKFKTAHYEDILTEFAKFGYSKLHFHFVKRKGRIITVHIKSKSEFSFFLKKKTSIDNRTEVNIHKSIYEIRIDGQEKFHLENWQNVLENLNEWLNGLDN